MAPVLLFLFVHGIQFVTAGRCVDMYMHGDIMNDFLCLSGVCLNEDNISMHCFMCKTIHSLYVSMCMCGESAFICI